MQPGTVHLAVPYDEHWRLTVDGTRIAPRRAFGTTMAFDVPMAGSARLAYDTDASRTVLILIQLVIWIALLVAASRLNPAAWRRWKGPDTVALGGPVVRIDEPIHRPGGGERWSAPAGPVDPLPGAAPEPAPAPAPAPATEPT